MSASVRSCWAFGNRGGITGPSSVLTLLDGSTVCPTHRSEPLYLGRLLVGKVMGAGTSGSPVL